MRNNWLLTNIGAMCDQGWISIQTGPFGSQLHAHDYEPIGIPVVPTEAIGRRILRTENLPRVSNITAQRLSRHRLLPGDILFARRGVQATGFSALVEPQHKNWLCGTGAIRLRIHHTEVDATYLSFAFSENKAIEWFKFQAVGAVMPNLNESIIRRFSLHLPPLPEQRAIAHILGSLDDKIELNRQMNETLEAMARALFKDWFVDFGPVRAKMAGQQPPGLAADIAALFPDALDGEGKPVGWKVTALYNLCNYIISGGTPNTKQENYWSGDIPWFSSGETRNTFIIDTEKRITSQGVKQSSTRLARSGSTVVAGAGQGHTRGQTSLLLLDSYINQSTVAVDPNTNMVSDLFVFFDLSRRYEELRQISDSHSSRGSLTTKLLGSIRVLYPHRDILIYFDQLIQPMVEKIKSNLIENKSSSQLRDLLLPKLLSGELRVRDAEALVAQRS